MVGGATTGVMGLGWEPRCGGTNGKGGDKWGTKWRWKLHGLTGPLTWSLCKLGRGGRGEHTHALLFSHFLWQRSKGSNPTASFSQWAVKKSNAGDLRISHKEETTHCRYENTFQKLSAQRPAGSRLAACRAATPSELTIWQIMKCRMKFKNNQTAATMRPIHFSGRKNALLASHSIKNVFSITPCNYMTTDIPNART